MKKLFIYSTALFWVGSIILLTSVFIVSETQELQVENKTGESVPQLADSSDGAELIDIGPGASLSTTTLEDGEVTYTTELREVEKQVYLDAAVVAKHNSISDCWMTIENIVYDVGEYAPFHPGGEEDIISSCGTDATIGFNTKGNNTPHSASAKALLKRYRVAKIGDPWGTITVTEEVRVAVSADGTIKEESSSADSNGSGPVVSNKPDTTTSPTESASPTVSGNFSLGTKIQTASNISVRKSPSTSGTLLAVENTGAVGRITSGPKSANGYIWYYIEYDSGVKGWSVQNFVKKYDPATDTTPTPTPDSTPSSSGLTPSAVASHNKASDCWMIISNKVYDVTDYVDFHVNGVNTIIPSCGKEATAAFSTKGNRGRDHLASSYNLLKNYFVGNLEGDSTSPADPNPEPEPDPDAPTCTSFTYSSWSSCQSDNTRTRSVVTSSPSGCTGGNPSTSGSCTYTPPSSGSLTPSAVASHNKASDCWLIISGKVYDIPEIYITDLHPGGDLAIINSCGYDATVGFDRETAHDSSARNTLDTYYIGDLVVDTTTPPDTDTTAPTVSITSPDNNSVVSDDATIRASASDANGVQEVRFTIDTITITTDTSSPYSATLDTTQYSDGGHTISAIARDTNGNTRTALITLIINNTPPPTGGTLTSAEVASHNSATDCWMIISNKVYDVTDYVDFHVNGVNTIIPSCGTEATTAFNTKGGRGRDHVANTYTLLINYYIGDIGAAPPPTCTSFTYSSWSSCQPNNTQTRTVNTSSPTDCIGGNPDLSQSCTYNPPSSDVTAADVADHSSAGNCWVIISDKVYDVTGYLANNIHPGGQLAITSRCGTDMTTAFNNVGHLSSTISMLTNEYYVADLTGPPPPPPATNEYTAADVAQHGSNSDCWMIINGGIYDLTSYINVHPGGRSAITDRCGRDGSSRFNNEDKHRSSERAELEGYRIGDLVTAPPPTCTSFTYSCGDCQPNNTQSCTVQSSSPSGCSGGNPETTQSCTYVPPNEPTTHDISVSNNFSPSSITISAGDSIEFTFTGDGEAKINFSPSGISSVKIDKEKRTATRTFDNPGTWTMNIDDGGGSGTITVQ